MKPIQVQTTSAMRQKIGERVQMYDNDWLTRLETEIKKHFHEKTAAKVLPEADTSMNIFRRIVREICTVYREPAKRLLVDGGDTAQAKIDEVYKAALVDQTMQVAHRYSKAATASFVVARLTEDGELALNVLTPDQVYVESDQDIVRKMRLFAYVSEVSDSKGSMCKIWTVYTPEERWYADEKGEPLVLDPRTGAEYDRENVYGIIPAVCFPAEFQVRGFWNASWNHDAAEANLKIGLLITYMNYLTKTQSFKQIVLGANSAPEGLGDQVLDPLFPLLLQDGATAQTLDLQTNLAAIDQVIRGKVMAIANNYGISNENFTLTSSAASGFSLKIANQALQDIRMADIPLCAAVEAELYKVIATVSGELPPDARFQFNPGEVSWPEEWPTERDRWEFEFKNGIASPVDYVLAYDPQKTREQAVAMIQERQAEIKSLKPRVSAWEVLLGGGNAMDVMPKGPAAMTGLAELPALEAPDDSPVAKVEEPK